MLYIWSKTHPEYSERMAAMGKLFACLQKHNSIQLHTRSLSLVPKG